MRSDRQYSCIDVLLLDFFFGKLLSFLFHLGVDLIKVVVEILKDHIELVRYQEHLFELNNVGVIQFPQRFDFSELDAFVPISIFLLHLFDSHHFSRLSISSLVDSTKRTISQCLYRLIFLHCTFNLSIKSISKTLTPSILRQYLQRP